MPVSKKRKKKREKPAGPPISKSTIAAKKKKITKRQILIYVFSGLIILSLAISFLVGGGSGVPADGQSGGQVAAPVVGGDGNNILQPGSENAGQADDTAPDDNASETDSGE